MTSRPVPRTTLVAILVAITAALIGRAWLQIQLTDDGMAGAFAADLSYLVVPPILVFLLFPLWRSQKTFVFSLFKRNDLTWHIAVRAVCIGVLLRMLAKAKLIAGVSFGYYKSTNPEAIVGPDFSFRLAAPENIILGLVVMAFLVPIIEEIVHRGYVMSALRRRGCVVSVLVSALAFTVFHKYSSWLFVFFAGVVFGLQYWVTNSLWPSLLTHATINGLIQVEQHFTSIHWNPRAADLPLWTPGIVAVVLFALSLTALVMLLRKMTTGAHEAPR